MMVTDCTDFARPDDADLEIATVLDEVSAANAKAAKKKQKPIHAVPCTYFLESDIPKTSTEKEKMAAIDTSCVDSLAGHDFVCAPLGRKMTFDSNYIDSIAGYGIACPEGLSYLETGSGATEPYIPGQGAERAKYLDMEQAERFYGPSLYQPELSAEVPEVDIQEVIETAKLHLTEQEMEDLHESARELNILEGRVQGEEHVEDSSGSLILQQLFEESFEKEEQFVFSHESTPVPEGEQQQVKRLPEDPDLGWLAGPSVSEGLSEIKSEELDLAQISKIAEAFVDNILHSSAVICNTLERATDRADQNGALGLRKDVTGRKKFQAPIESAGRDKVVMPSEMASSAVYPSHELEQLQIHEDRITILERQYEELLDVLAKLGVLPPSVQKQAGSKAMTSAAFSPTTSGRSTDTGRGAEGELLHSLTTVSVNELHPGEGYTKEGNTGKEESSKKRRSSIAEKAGHWLHSKVSRKKSNKWSALPCCQAKYNEAFVPYKKKD